MHPFIQSLDMRRLEIKKNPEKERPSQSYNANLKLPLGLVVYYKPATSFMMLVDQNDDDYLFIHLKNISKTEKIAAPVIDKKSLNSWIAPDIKTGVIPVSPFVAISNGKALSDGKDTRWIIGTSTTAGCVADELNNARVCEFLKLLNAEFYYILENGHWSCIYPEYDNTIIRNSRVYLTCERCLVNLATKNILEKEFTEYSLKEVLINYILVARKNRTGLL